MQKPNRSLLARLQAAAVCMILLLTLSVFFAWHGLQSIIRDMTMILLDSTNQVSLLEPLEQRFTSLHQQALSAALLKHQGAALSEQQKQALLDQVERLDQQWANYQSQANKQALRWTQNLDPLWHSCMNNTRMLLVQAGVRPYVQEIELFAGQEGDQCRQVAEVLNDRSNRYRAQSKQIALKVLRASRAHQRLLLLGSLSMVVLGLLFFVWTLLRLRARLGSLTLAAWALAEGDLRPLTLEIGSDEFAQIMHAMQILHGRLSQLVQEAQSRQQQSDLLAHRYALQSSVHQLLLHSQPMDQIVRHFCERMVQRGQYPLIWVGVRNQASIWQSLHCEIDARMKEPELVLGMLDWVRNAVDVMRVWSAAELAAVPWFEQLRQLTGNEPGDTIVCAVDLARREPGLLLLVTRREDSMDAEHQLLVHELVQELGFVCRMHQNWQEQQRLSAELRQHQHWLERAQKAARFGMWYRGEDPGILHLSQEACYVFQMMNSVKTLSVAALVAHIHPGDRGRCASFFQESLCLMTVDVRVLDEAHAEHWLHLEWHSWEEDSQHYQLGTVQDITERKEREEQLQRLSLAIDQTASTVVMTDSRRRIVYVNQSFERTTGYTLAETHGLNPRILQSGKTPRSVYEAMNQALNEGRNWQGEFVNRRKDGSEYTEYAKITPVRQQDGRITHYLAVNEDVSEQRRIQQELERLAYEDGLTHLPNRHWFMKHLLERVEKSSRERSSLALIFIDLNRFKDINDTQGHTVGDQLLRHLADSVRGNLQAEQVFSRVSGDEFVILLEEKDQAVISALAWSVLNVIRLPIYLQGVRCELDANMGIALFPDDSTTAEDLLRHADLAMHDARSEQSPIGLYQKRLGEQAERRMELFRRLSLALEENRLQLYVQPQVRLDNAQLIGVEALLRWHDPEWGWVSPAEFIPLAEERGLIQEIGRWVLRESARWVHRWLERGYPLPGRMAVNVSALQLNDPNFLATTLACLQEMNVEPERIELEITESATMKHPDASIALLQQIAEAGFSLAIDDFGTGYSSMAYLKRFSAQVLKIDQSFVRGLLSDANDRAIVAATIAMGHSLGMHTLAEGVETEDEANALRSMGCELAQGYFYARPMPAADLEKTWLASE